MRNVLSAVFAVLSFLVAWTAHGQPQPTQCQLQVDAGLDGTPLMGAVIYGPGGGSLAAYSRSPSFSNYEIWIQRFAADGSSLGGPLAVSSGGFNIFASVSDLGIDPLGNYWIVWSEWEAVGEATYARRLAPNGTFVGPQVEVGSSPTVALASPSVAANGSGSVLVWASDGRDGEGAAVVTRWVASDGTLGPEQQVNVFRAGDQRQTRVASNDSGEFLVVWSGRGPGGPREVSARRLAADGSPVGGELQIGGAGNTAVAPDVVGDGTGFRVVWSETTAPGVVPHDVFVRGVDAAGTAGPAVPVTDGTDERSGFQPRIDRLSGGEFVVAWEEIFQDIDSGNLLGTYAAVAARKLDASGSPVGAQLQVNTTEFSDTSIAWIPRPAVAAAPAGDEFAVVWEGPGPLDDRGIFLQRYDGPTGAQPADLAVTITERRDPADHRSEFWYSNEIVNRTACGAQDATLVQQLPAGITSISVDGDDPWSCSLGGSTLDCEAESLPLGRSKVRVSFGLPETASTVETTSTVASADVDPNPSDNEDTETTQVVLCYDLARAKVGDGGLPQVEPISGAPCDGGRRQAGQTFDVVAQPAPGGWRVAGWSGTDDDASTSRFNTFTMPGEDHEVSVSYVFDDLVSWWTFDSTLDDLSGNHPLAFETGPLSTEPGFDNSGFLFDGADYLSTPDAPGLDLGTGDLTFGLWVKTSAGAGALALVDKRAAGPLRGVHTFLFDGRPGIQLADGAAVLNFVSPRSIADGALRQVVWSVDRDRADGLRIYIDGALDSSFDPRPVAGPLGNTELLTIGRRSDGLGSAAFFNGLLDEVFLVARALEPGEVTETLGPSGRWRGELDAEDDTAFGNRGFLQNNAGFTVGSCSDAAFLFGLRDAVSIPFDSSLAPTSERLTWAAWVRVAAENSSDPRRVIQHGLEGLGTGYGLVLTAGSPELRLYRGSGAGFPSGLPDLRDGQWHFLAMTLEGGGEEEATFYLDDRPPVTVPLSFVSSVSDNTEPFYFGSTGIDGFVGALDEVHYFRRILRPEQIEGVRNACRPPLFADGFESGNLGAWSSVVQP
ncbi:MAG: LamG-like jellyroll fold domain-containing protein [Acidobacteriota bacterium]